LLLPTVRPAVALQFVSPAGWMDVSISCARAPGGASRAAASAAAAQVLDFAKLMFSSARGPRANQVKRWVRNASTQGERAGATRAVA
jgi:hypothetical protein